MATDFKRKLTEFLKTNYDEVGVGYIRKIEKEEEVSSLNDLPEFRQIKILNCVIENLFSKFFSKERMRNYKLILFSEIFGRETAVENAFKNNFMKGTPPVDFIYYFFGKDLGEDILKITSNETNKKDIGKKDDAAQIEFVKRCINLVFGEREEYRKDVLLNFFRYLRMGKEYIKPTFHERMNSGKYRDIVEIIETLEELYRRNHRNNEEINKLINSLSLDSEDKKSLLMLLFNEDMSKKEKPEDPIDKRNPEKEIVVRLGRFVETNKAANLVEEAKIYADISDLSKTFYDKKIEFTNYIISHTRIENYSPQKEALIKSWLKMILRI